MGGMTGRGDPRAGGEFVMAAAAPTDDELDAELLRAAARRLGLVALTVASTQALAFALVAVRVHVLGWSSLMTPLHPARIVVQTSWVLASVGLFLLSRRGIAPRRVVNLGIAYQLLGALVLAAIYRSDERLQPHITGVGWLGVWIVVFPLFVPARPLENIVTSHLAAATAPAVYFLFAAVEGRPVASLQVLASTFVPYFWCAGVAVVPAVLLHRLGRQAIAARRELRRLDVLLRTERLAVAGSLAAGVAHEVNNPLAAISSLVQTVRGRSADARDQERLGQALTHIDRISAALRELLRFARPPARVPRACSLNEVVARTLELLGHDPRFRRLAVETRLDGALAPLQADPDQLQQVLANLLLNARDALQGRPDARVVVATRGSTTGAEVTVTDNGPGVPPSARERLFEPFFSTKPPGEGTGLGLAVCRELLREHGGTIALEDAAGGGTTARVVLPRGGAAA